METYFDSLREFAPLPELGARIVGTYPPAHSPAEPCAPEITSLVRQPKAAAQALAITGTAKHSSVLACIVVVRQQTTCRVAAQSRRFYPDGHINQRCLLIPPAPQSSGVCPVPMLFHAQSELWEAS